MSIKIKYLMIFLLILVPLALAVGYDNYSLPAVRSGEKVIIDRYYGGMWYHNHTGTEINFLEAEVYYNLFFVNATHINGFIFQGGFNEISNLTALQGGLYDADYMAVGSGENNHDYITSIFINGIPQDNCDVHKQLTAGVDLVTMTGTCLIDVAQGDVVDLRIADITGTGTGNYYGGNLKLIRVDSDGRLG